MVTGVIKNDENALINEEVKVLWESKTGELLAETIADKTTGGFKLDAPVLKASSSMKIMPCLSRVIIISSSRKSLKLLLNLFLTL